MALYYDLPVFKEVYQLTLRLFQLTTDFPREYKFTLGQDLKRDCIILVRYIYRANKTKDKTQYLEQFLDHFEKKPAVIWKKIFKKIHTLHRNKGLQKVEEKNQNYVKIVVQKINKK